MSWERLRLRLKRWKKFGRDHPNLPETKSEVDTEIRREFAARDSQSRYHELISSLLAKIDAQHQTMTQENRPLFARFGMGTEFDAWWRVVDLRLNRS